MLKLTYTVENIDLKHLNWTAYRKNIQQKLGDLAIIPLNGNKAFYALLEVSIKVGVSSSIEAVWENDMHL